ncbi:ABC-three component system middle component 5 [Pseudomonas serbica]|jgi:hypothetical protein
MLIYHPAYDAYHCVFRMLCIVSELQSVELDKARLLDFYLLFPSAIAKIRLPKSHYSGRQLAKLLANVYRDPINPSATFRELRYIQEAALKCMVASGFVDAKSYESGLMVRTKLPLPESMLEATSAYIKNNLELTGFVLGELATIPLKGLDGLKDRTGLMEYRYDVV